MLMSIIFSSGWSALTSPRFRGALTIQRVGVNALHLCGRASSVSFTR